MRTRASISSAPTARAKCASASASSGRTASSRRARSSPTGAQGHRRSFSPRTSSGCSRSRPRSCCSARATCSVFRRGRCAWRFSSGRSRSSRWTSGPRAARSTYWCRRSGEWPRRSSSNEGARRATGERHRGRKPQPTRQSFEADRLEQLRSCYCSCRRTLLVLVTAIPLRPVSSARDPPLDETLSVFGDMVIRSQITAQALMWQGFSPLSSRQVCRCPAGRRSARCPRRSQTVLDRLRPSKNHRLEPHTSCGVLNSCRQEGARKPPHRAIPCRSAARAA